MSKVLGMHTIALRPGVKPQDFEHFIKTELPKTPMFEGWKMHVLKGERGERVGRYLVLIEIDSLEARNRYSPSEDAPSPEFEPFLKSHPEFGKFVEKLRTFAPALPGDGTIFTDYVQID